MELSLDRYASNNVSTLGKLSLDGHTECFVCEDAFHEVKIPGKTRIPAGRYEVKLKPLGNSRLDASYGQKFPFHVGMLELQAVPGFAGILIHIGNGAEDTEGCLLLGGGTVVDADHNVSMKVTDSKVTYEKVYPKIVAALQHGPVFITIHDNDRKPAQ